MKQKNLILVLAAIFSVLLLAVVWHSVQNERQSHAPQTQGIDIFAVFPADVSRRIKSISNGLEKTGIISDSDLDFLLKASQSKPVNGVAGNDAELRVRVRLLALSPFVQVRQFTPLQQNKILAAVTPLLASSNRMDKDIALHVLGHLNSQAIPYIEPLTRDADRETRQRAVNTIKFITSRQSR